MMARFSIVERRLFQSVEAESISDALRSAIRQMTLMTLTSETPKVANMLMTEVVLSTLVVLIVDSIDESKIFLPTWNFLKDVGCELGINSLPKYEP
jgi:hypothetical protein